MSIITHINRSSLGISITSMAIKGSGDQNVW